MINYQGRLVDGTNLVNGVVPMAFRIYTNDVGGAHVYESTNLVTVVDGLYATIIGEHMTMGTLDAALDHGQVWLEVEVDGTILSPRERILAVPYARRVHGLRVGANASVALNPDQNNLAAGSQSVVGGGFDNTASGSFSTIGGGAENSAYGTGATVGGGNNNQAGGAYETVGGGRFNNASGEIATVPGGMFNAANAFGSFAAKFRAHANHQGSFVWGDSVDAQVNSSSSNEVTFRAAGGFRIFSNSLMTTGVVLAANSGAWTSLSDVNAKEEFDVVDTAEVLEKLAQMPITTWRYIGQDHEIRHMGPTAQDFHAAFGLGDRPGTGITTVDADGVAFAAIQGLNGKVAELEAENEALRAELEAIKRHLGM